MNIKRFLLLAIIVVVAVGAPGCKLPASTAPAATSTTGSEFPVPGTETMRLFETIATQTAVPVKTPVPPTPTKKPVVVPKATSGRPASYTLQKGEFPYCIARRFNVNPGELLSINGLTGSSVTFPGMKLTIPQTGHTFPDGRELHNHPANYTVKSGDTIFRIACFYGNIDPFVIADVNGISSPYNLTSGQVLQIP